MLVLTFYNGSMMEEFTFGVDKALESRRQRTLHHSLNFKCKITQVVPIRISNGNQSYLVRDETELVHMIKPSVSL